MAKSDTLFLVLDIATHDFMRCRSTSPTANYTFILANLFIGGIDINLLFVKLKL